MNRTKYNISSIKRVTRNVTRTFLEVSRCRHAKQQQRNVQKKCAARAKFFFLFLANETYYFLFCFVFFFVFAVFDAVAALLALHNFIFCFSKL